MKQCPIVVSKQFHISLLFLGLFDYVSNAISDYLSYIYLGYFVCVCVCVCVSQFVSERSAILLVLAIKLTKETRRKV
jgi:hypothetical protein